MTVAQLIVAGLLGAVQSPAAPADAATPNAGRLAAVLADQRQRMDVVKRVSPAVACLFGKEAAAGGGSGVIIDPTGYGLTNFHVVAGLLPDRAGTAGLPDHKKYDIEVLGLDPHGDVAMFRAIGRDDFPAAIPGDSDALQVGDECLAMGNPFLLADDFSPTVTFGIVSGLHRYQWGAGRALMYTDCIQVDASINPGNSGGPLFDAEGRLVGINGRISIEERSRVNVGVGYAIPINQIKRFIPALRAGLTTPHASAGFTLADAGRRAVVNQIDEDSAAFRSGLRVGDQVVRFGGVDIRSANQFASQLGSYPANWPVELVYQRDGKTIRNRFRLDALPLPEPRRRPGGGPRAPKRPDPFADTPATNAANRRAAKLAFERYLTAIGGQDAARNLKSIRGKGVRRLADRPQADPQPLELSEDRETIPSNPSDASEKERAIRWQLIHDALEADQRTGKVVQSDEVHGRIGVVIERVLETGAADRLSYRICLDDADGRLLAIEFEDAGSGRRVRFEYDDERRCGPLKLPHRRRLFANDDLFAEDEFERIDVAGE
jgi:S1-C subfamily serine protease